LNNFNINYSQFKCARLFENSFTMILFASASWVYSTMGAFNCLNWKLDHDSRVASAS